MESCGVRPLVQLKCDLHLGSSFDPAGHLVFHFNSVFQDMKWIEEKQALYRRNQELVEKVRPERQCGGPGAWAGWAPAEVPLAHSPAVLLCPRGSPGPPGVWASPASAAASLPRFVQMVQWVVMVRRTLKSCTFKNHWNHPIPKPCWPRNHFS